MILLRQRASSPKVAVFLFFTAKSYADGGFLLKKLQFFSFFAARSYTDGGFLPQKLQFFSFLLQNPMPTAVFFLKSCSFSLF